MSGFANTNTCSNPSKSRLVRLMILGGDVMLGRAIQLSLPHQSRGDELIRDSQSAMTYAAMALELNISSRSILPDISTALENLRKQNGDQATYLWGDVLSLHTQPAPDICLFNLETAVTTSIHNTDVPIEKGINYHLHTDNLPLIIGGLASGFPGLPIVSSMANNHALDFGRIAFDTETLPKAIPNTEAAALATGGQFHLIGSGRNIEEAQRPIRLSILHNDHTGPDVVICAAACECAGTPHQWAAKQTRSGVVWLPCVSSIEAVDVAAELMRNTIITAAESGAIVVVSIHWGPNWAGKGTDRLDRKYRQQLAHRLIDMGADLIYGHSSHHIRGMEIYKERLILYGCGDLVNDYEGFTNAGEDAYSILGGVFLVDLEANTGCIASLRIVPMQMQHLAIHRVTSESQMRKGLHKKGKEALQQLEQMVNELSVYDSVIVGKDNHPVTVSLVNDSSVPGGPILRWKANLPVVETKEPVNAD